MPRYGLTAQEMKYLPLRSISYKRGSSILDVLILAVFVGLSFGILVSIFSLGV